jgi:valyl-tRNA synthetase
VQQVEMKGHLWHIRYPLEGTAFDPDDPSTFITVATTRPETMLGDVAVAVHPDDERYRHLVGRHAVLPLVGRRIPIVADEYSDPEKGTGAVKITPAHDFNDFEVGRRHDLPLVNVLDAQAHLKLAGNDAFLRDVPGSPELDLTLAYDGLDRFVARKEIVRRLEGAGLLAKTEPHTHTVPHGDRSAVVIEPFLTDQWYADAKTLAAPAIAAVRGARTAFVPRNWEATYFNWMENIQPWCISRQLWWGHQIPAWYGPDGKVFVAESEAEALNLAMAHYATDGTLSSAAADDVRRAGAKLTLLTRDEDVLDTWFSSALWPFSTLGWPDETPGGRALLPDRRAVDRLRHHLLLGRAHDDDGPALHARSAVPRPSISTRSCATSAAPRCRSRKATLSTRSSSSTSTAPTRCASRSPPWRRRGATSSFPPSAWRATATSRPSCGTPAASRR